VKNIAQNGQNQTEDKRHDAGAVTPRMFLVLIPVAFILTFLGCTPPEQTARDVVAASRGAIVAAQVRFHDQCVTAPNVSPCDTITKAIQVQHVAIDALRVYCSFTPTTPIDAKCAPVKSALSALQSALANLNQVTLDIQAVTK